MRYEDNINQIMDKFWSFGYKSHMYPNVVGLWPEEAESLVYCGLIVPDYNFLEIGSMMGGSAVLMCLTKRALGQATKIISIDIDFNAFQGAFRRNINRVGRFTDISIPIECSSFDLLKYYNEPISLALIDGYHSYKAVITDFINVDSLMVKGGIALFHDTFPQKPVYTENQLKEFYRSAVKNHDLWMSEVLPTGKFASAAEYYEAEKKQNFLIDEAIAYILSKYNYRLLSLPTIGNQTHFDRVKEYIHGSTSPFPGLVAIQKL